jgi:hypothetical protein
MENYLEDLGSRVGNFLRVGVLTYLIFCVFIWGYYMFTLQQVPDDCSFFSLSAHIGFMVLIFMFSVICI